jgi:3-hydroxyisobutyrate dehydrogenase
MKVGFLGLGHMGEPMAANLVRAGTPLLAWNRSERALQQIALVGAQVASSAREALRSSETAILMLANAAAIDQVLERGTEYFEPNVAGRTLVHMGTTAPEYSLALSTAVARAGGRYVEAPVSGSRIPAEEGSLVAMLAGEGSAVAEVRALIAPMCRQSFECGEVPNALRMKLAVNLFLITMVTGLVEATHFAANHGLNMEQLRAVIDCGPMASSVSVMKLDKIVRSDFSAQAALHDVLMNSQLIAEAARAAKIATPVLDQCHQLFFEADGTGFGGLDMIGVVGALEFHTSTLRMLPAEIAEA